MATTRKTTAMSVVAALLLVGLSVPVAQAATDPGERVGAVEVSDPAVTEHPDDETTTPDAAPEHDDVTASVSDDLAVPAADDESVEPTAALGTPDAGLSTLEMLVPGPHPTGERLEADGVSTRAAVMLSTIRGQAYPGAVTGEMRIAFALERFPQARVRYVAPTGTTIDQIRTNGAGVTFTVSEDRRSVVSSVADWHGGSQNAFLFLRVDDDLVPGDVLDDGVLQMLDGETVAGQADLVVEVTGHLEITTQPSSVTVMEGGRGEISTTVTGFAPVTQWQVSTDGGASWTDVEGATGTVLVTEPVTREMEGHRYRSVHRNVAGEVESAPATLRVTFIIPAAHGFAAPGESAELRIYDFTAMRRGIMRIDAPPGTTISAVRHNGTGRADVFAISEDGTSATTSNPDFQWGSAWRSAWVTLTVDDEAAPGSVLAGGTATITGASGILLAQAELSVTVTGEIDILEHPDDVTVDVGTTAELTTAVAGHAVTTTWQVSDDSGRTWVDIDGATGTTLTIEETTPEMSGLWFHAVHENAGGPETTDHAVLRVRTAPTFTQQLPSETIADPGTLVVLAPVALDNTTDDPLPVSWEYSRDGIHFTPYQPGTFPDLVPAQNILVLDPVSAEMDGVWFQAVAENHLGTTVSTPGLLTVEAAPVIDPQPADRRVFEGGTATFVASTPAVSPHRAQQWQERVAGGDWVDIPGATEATYTTVPATREMDQREYRVVFTNRHGSTESDPAVLTVFEPVEASVLLTPTARLVDRIA